MVSFTSNNEIEGGMVCDNEKVVECRFGQGLVEALKKEWTDLDVLEEKEDKFVIKYRGLYAGGR